MVTSHKMIVNQELLEKIPNILEESKSELEESLLFSSLMKRLVMECNTAKKLHKPDCSEFLLCTLALLVFRQKATVDQIAIFLSLIFPALLPHLTELKEALLEVLSEEKEFVGKEKDGKLFYEINTIELKNAKKMLEEFAKIPHNFNGLKEAYFDDEGLHDLLMLIDLKV